MNPRAGDETRTQDERAARAVSIETIKTTEMPKRQLRGILIPLSMIVIHFSILISKHAIKLGGKINKFKKFLLKSALNIEQKKTLQLPIFFSGWITALQLDSDVLEIQFYNFHSIYFFFIFSTKHSLIFFLYIFSCILYLAYTQRTIVLGLLNMRVQKNMFYIQTIFNP